MHDYLPEELKIWNHIEIILREVLTSYCYSEIRLPLLEKTEIFTRAIGNITDVVEKEMYSFYDRKGNSLTLRPEGTVGCVRSVIQNRLLNNKKNNKFWYLGPMFRYERPQKGRYRQFYQLGAEVFGLDTEDIDLEIILLTNRLWKVIGVDCDLELEINSIGSKTDRFQYKKELVHFLKKYEHQLDDDSKKRLYTNPLRILDTKNKNVEKILEKAPLLSKYINFTSKKNFENLCNMITSHGIKYKYNEKLVRGLDYYNNTVFEWKSNKLGAQNTICAGGRYDFLVKEMGGQETSAIGFAIGMERLILLSKSLKLFSNIIEEINIYIIYIGEKYKYYAVKLSEEIRNLYPKLKIFVNFYNQNLTKKIKNAVNSSARIAILIGSDEIKQEFFLVKDLKYKKEFHLIKKELMVNKMFNNKIDLSKFDPEIWTAIEKEKKRQEQHIELIASENYTSNYTMIAQGSQLTNKYAEGYPGKRYYGGCKYVDIIEELAIKRAKKLFDADYANVQPHSGSQANFSVYTALLKPGDTILGMKLSHGGHLTHGSPVNFSGKIYRVISYGVDKNGKIDYEELLKLTQKHKPKMIIGGFSAYSRICDWHKMRQIADEVNAYLVVDMAHIAGLVAAKIYPNPIYHAHIVTSTTHKTLAGPRGGIILAKNGNDSLYKKLDLSVFPGTQGGPLMHVIAAKAIAFKEALEPKFTVYQKQIVKNARIMSQKFMEKGYKVISQGTDNHLFLIDLTNQKLTGKVADLSLSKANITVNKNTIPDDVQSPFITSGIRIGTPSITRRGFKEKEVSEVSNWICSILNNINDVNNIINIKNKVLEICLKFPVYI